MLAVGHQSMHRLRSFRRETCACIEGDNTSSLRMQCQRVDLERLDALAEIGSQPAQPRQGVGGGLDVQRRSPAISVQHRPDRQALQHRASELFCDIEMTRAIVIRALQAVDEDPVKARDLVSAAKARACTTANRAVQEGVQMHGGMGMTDQFDIGLFMKRARVVQELLGDAHFHADRHATLNAY